MNVKQSVIAISCAVLLAGCQSVSATGTRTLATFSVDNSQCYDRKAQPSYFAVDSHHHFQPFRGDAVPFDKLVAWAERAGVVFINVYGIGQTYERKPDCFGERGCYSQLISPSIQNDFKNASNYLKYGADSVHLTLSMTFADLHKPETILPKMALLEDEFGDLFRWMGEVNLVKAAHFGNGHQAVDKETIAKWQPFMAVLKEKRIPLALHADLGDNNTPLKYLPLLEEVLKRYPENDIIWMHMGVSKELNHIDPELHINTMERLFSQYKNLKADLSWRILYDYYFSDPEIKAQYVEFINAHAERFLPGSDFVASKNKRFFDYLEEVDINSRILAELDDNAFRQIALGQNYFSLLDLPYRAPEICVIPIVLSK
ncbi:amidohydrolase family protein [Pseudoalteromonas piscicida]|uniref:Amidohydrolase n=1 Tax=Pseudoalteromonas piscicida TaxID=43662 RepID=A0AAD0RNV9_PSEO7|nr:amidohydrolase family protein [Pseudoalteromonas piscicida]ASD67369.1 amidohydrolase [Pseudoalteromonas piscicida]AXR01928.1 amidohydrolase [Pseudoalteromonas piscicida]